MPSMSRPNNGAQRHLLVVNPNTNPAVTALIRRTIAEAATPGICATVVGAERGPFSIETDAQRADAVPGLLDVIEPLRSNNYDGYIIACFDDIGVAETRAMVSKPVLDLSEAGMTAARQFGPFAIITTVAAAIPRIEALAGRYGVAGQCRVYAAEIGVAEAAAQTELAWSRLTALTDTAKQEHGARAILLGSGGFAGMARPLGERSAIAVIDGVVAAVEAMADQ